MKSLLDFLTESKGADLKDRKWSRFFGDEYSKDTDIKKIQWRAKKFLKDNKDSISEKSYDFLMKLATLANSTWMDRRSHFSASYSKEWDEWDFDFNITSANMPDSIKNRLYPSL